MANVLSVDNVREVARLAGFTGKNLDIAVAVARAESGFDADAVGDGGNSIGLWQIHLPSWPRFKGQHLKNPLVNAQAARIVASTGRKWGHWTTYRNGTYRQYMSNTGTSGPGGLPPSGNPISDSVGAIATAADQLRRIGDVTANLTNPILWLRVASGLLGVVLTVLGLGVLLMSTDTGKQLGKTMTSAATRGLVG